VEPAAAQADKNLCPTCDTQKDSSVLDKVRLDLGRYQAAQDLGTRVSFTWAEQNWASLVDLEQTGREQNEPALISENIAGMADHSLTATQVNALWARRAELRPRIAARLEGVRAERLQIEQRLPPSLVEVTTSVEANRVGEHHCRTSSHYPGQELPRPGRGSIRNSGVLRFAAAPGSSRAAMSGAFCCDHSRPGSTGTGQTCWR
jgi:hypothetical protein